MRPLYSEITKSQDGLCPICNTDLSLEEFEVHYILPRFLGEKDTFGNLTIVHLMCHNKIYYGKDFTGVTNMLISYERLYPKQNKPTGGISPGLLNFRR